MLRNIFSLLGFMFLLTVPVIAQEGRLVAPRHITFGSDGSLYVAYAGNGGDTQAQGPFGPATAGASSGIAVIRPDGSQEDVLLTLSSMDWGGGDTIGAHIVYPTDDGLWMLIGQGDRRNPFNYALVKLEPENWRVMTYVDLYSFEHENNPDGEIIDSNPVDLAIADDGTIYIADAGANSVLKWSESGGVELFNTWTEDNPVPTSVEVDGEGNVYVSFLTGFPFAAGGSRVEKYSPAGELLETISGLNPTVDLELYGDTLYAVELGTFGDMGWTSNTGRVVTVSSAGVEVVAEGLNLPYGMAIDANGTVFVAVNSNASMPGQIWKLGENGVISNFSGGVPSPVTTPEQVPPPVATEDAG